MIDFNQDQTYNTGTQIMANISIAEAQCQFLALISRVEAGEEIAVTRDGKPVARLVAFKTDDPQAHAERVGQAFRRLAALRYGVGWKVDLKPMARKGLD